MASSRLTAVNTRKRRGVLHSSASTYRANKGSVAKWVSARGGHLILRLRCNLVALHCLNYETVLGEAALAEHRMHQLAVHDHVERAVIPGNQLDLRKLVAELHHERLG